MKCPFPVNVSGRPQAADQTVSIRPLLESEGAATWHIPTETPVAFVYNRRNFAVMLATPLDIVDFAVGFSLTEDIIQSARDIQKLDVMHSDTGIDLRIDLTPPCLERFDIKERRRNMTGRAGCGVCGLENADTLFRALPKVSEAPVALNRAAIEKSIQALDECQTLNRRTRSVHGAAWVDENGRMELLREDVGRHNALDKLLGALALGGVRIEKGFVLMSSRCSYELVEKAVRVGVKALVTISGPTGFAVQKAKEANLTLYARGSSGAVEIVG